MGINWKLLTIFIATCIVIFFGAFMTGVALIQGQYFKAILYIFIIAVLIKLTDSYIDG